MLAVFKPLARPAIARLWLGQVLSATGDEIYKVALIWLAVGAIGVNAGYLSALEAASVLAVGLLAAPLADAWDHRRTMIGVDLLRAAVVLAVPLVAWRAGVSVWLLLPVAVVVSGASALFDPALQAMLPDLVPERAALHATNALLETTRRMARILGPGLVGVLTVWLPAVQFFTLDAASFAISALSVAALGRGRGVSPEAPRPMAHMSVLASLQESLAALRGQALLRYAMACSGLVWAFWYLGFALGLALLVHQRMPGNLGAFGALIASYGVGNTLANVVIGTRPVRHPGRMMFGGLVVLGIGFAAIAIAPTLPLMMAAAALMAVGGPMDDLAFLALVQVAYEGRAIARIYRLRMVVGHAFTLVAFLASPWLFSHLPIPTVIGACGGLIAVLGVVGLARYGRGPGVA